jgi:hypothetical protein
MSEGVGEWVRCVGEWVRCGRTPLEGIAWNPGRWGVDDHWYPLRILLLSSDCHCATNGEMHSRRGTLIKISYKS